MNDCNHNVWFVSQHYGRYLVYNNEWGDKIAFSEFCTLDNRQNTEKKLEGIFGIKHSLKNSNNMVIKGQKINLCWCSHRSGIWPKPWRNKRYNRKAYKLESLGKNSSKSNYNANANINISNLLYYELFSFLLRILEAVSLRS